MNSEYTLKSFEFRREREKTWERLERLVDKVESKGIGALSAQQLMELPELYRATVSSLSVARSISLDRALLDYLEALSQRAYFCVYATKRGVLQVVAEFFTKTWPRAVRAMWIEIALAFGFLVVGTLVGFILTSNDEDRFYTFVSEQLAAGRGPTATEEDLREVLYGEGHGASDLAVFSAFLFQNNARVGILAFALGFLAGVPTALLLLSTGFMLGAFTALHHNRGLGVDIWGWLLIHGVTELSAVVLCAAAGFAIGRSLVFPGFYGRLVALRRVGRKAGVVVMGGVVMFLVAGVLEGVLRQTINDIAGRFLIAGATAVFWGCYFIFAGRENP